jgi:hypothetical protein
MAAGGVIIQLNPEIFPRSAVNNRQVRRTTQIDLLVRFEPEVFDGNHLRAANFNDGFTTIRLMCMGTNMKAGDKRLRGNVPQWRRRMRRRYIAKGRMCSHVVILEDGVLDWQLNGLFLRQGDTMFSRAHGAHRQLPMQVPTNAIINNNWCRSEDPF